MSPTIPGFKTNQTEPQCFFAQSRSSVPDLFFYWSASSKFTSFKT